MQKEIEGRKFLPNLNGNFIMEFMSKEGYDKLVAELNELIEVELPKAIDAVAEARDKGDLSENFEYHAAKREQGRLLGRIRYKQNILAHARVLDSSSLKTDCVQLLSTVQLFEMNKGRKMSFTIVSPHEANIREGKISVKSPIAQALMNKRKGEIVEVHVPAGLLKLRIDDF
jgi:transcription elongation factor GreA